MKQFNKLLAEYSKSNQDICIANHENLRDPNWTMFEDNKHIRKVKIPKFASNIIKALKQAYNIKNKSELFDFGLHTGNDNRTRTTNNARHHSYNNQGYINEVPVMPRQQIDLRNRLRNIANYYLKNDSVHNEKAEDKIR